MTSELPTNDWYEAAFIEHGMGKARVNVLENHSHPEHTGMGITEALLPLVQRILNRQVVSSANRRHEEGEYRTSAAGKVWKRLVSKGKAVYDEVQDRFLLNQEPSDFNPDEADSEPN